MRTRSRSSRRQQQQQQPANSEAGAGLAMASEPALIQDEGTSVGTPVKKTRTKRGGKKQHQQQTSDLDGTNDEGDEQSHFTAALASLVSRASSTQQKGAGSKDVTDAEESKRPRQRRGRSGQHLRNQNEADGLTLEEMPVHDQSYSNQHHGNIGNNEYSTSPNPSMLSKSAPTVSFLEGNGGRRTRKQSSRVEQLDSYQTTNSADEWDMPLAGKGNDALTWQQQVLSRKPSNGSGNRRAQSGRKQGNGTAREPLSGISALAAASSRHGDRQADSASAPPQSNAAAPSSLTWQQQLFRSNSASSTPTQSDLFSALEDGYSGAHPAKDNRRASPTKGRAGKRSTEAVDDSKNGRMSARVTSQRSGTPSNSASRSIPPFGASYAHQRQATSGSDSGSINEDIANLSLGEEGSTVQHGRSSFPAQAHAPIPISSSPTKGGLYAGPKFHNSPSAGQLPTPRLAAFMSRAANRSSPTPQAQTPPVLAS